MTTSNQSKIDRFLQPHAKRAILETLTIPDQISSKYDVDQGDLSVESKAFLLKSLNPLDKYFGECELNDDNIVDLR